MCLLNKYINKTKEKRIWKGNKNNSKTNCKKWLFAAGVNNQETCKTAVFINNGSSIIYTCGLVAIVNETTCNFEQFQVLEKNE